MEESSRPLTLKEVAERLNVGEKTVRRMVARGEFPRPRYLGGSPRWFEEDVTHYLYRLRRGDVGTIPPPRSPKKVKKSPAKDGHEGTSRDKS